MRSCKKRLFLDFQTLCTLLRKQRTWPLTSNSCFRFQPPLANLTWMTFKRFLRLYSPRDRYRPPRTLISMDMRYLRIPWAVSKKRANMQHLWIYKNLNQLVVVNLDIAKDGNNELHILVNNFFRFSKSSNYFRLFFVRYLYGAVSILCKCVLAYHIWWSGSLFIWKSAFHYSRFRFCILFKNHQKRLNNMLYYKLRFFGWFANTVIS